MSRPRLVLLAVSVVVLGLLVFWFLRSGSREKIRPPSPAVPSETNGAASGDAAAPSLSGPPRLATLFFAREEDDRLVGEEREIPSDPSPVREARAIIAELIKGPVDGGLRTLPEGTTLGQAFLTKDGTAYVDFSRDIVARHPSGSSAELATVYAVVDSLAYNIKAVKRVFILIDGEERETFNGHVRLDRPFRPDFDLIAKR